MPDHLVLRSYKDTCGSEVDQMHYAVVAWSIKNGCKPYQNDDKFRAWFNAKTGANLPNQPWGQFTRECYRIIQEIEAQ